MTAMDRNMDFMVRMLNGEKLTTEQIEEESGRSAKTASRDMAAIGSIVHDLPGCVFYQKIIGKANKQFWITKEALPFDEALALLKILIGTRSLNKEEMLRVKDHLLSFLPDKKREPINKLVASTVASYTPVFSKQELLPKIAEFATYIQNRTPITFVYSSTTQNGVHKDNGLPVGLTFSDFYFYVVLYKPAQGRTFFYRLDRFSEVKLDTSKPTTVPRSKKIDEGESVNKTYLLNDGGEITYEFKYWNYPQTALDRLPGSKITHQNDDGSVTIKGSGFAQGMVLWILSQGSRIQVLQPQSLIDEVKTEVAKMATRYQ